MSQLANLIVLYYTTNHYKNYFIMYDNQLKTAIKQRNISAITIVIFVFALGVVVGVLFNPAIIQFIETLTKNLK